MLNRRPRLPAAGADLEARYLSAAIMSGIDCATTVPASVWTDAGPWATVSILLAMSSLMPPHSRRRQRIERGCGYALRRFVTITRRPSGPAVAAIFLRFLNPPSLAAGSRPVIDAATAAPTRQSQK